MKYYKKICVAVVALFSLNIVAQAKSVEILPAKASKIDVLMLGVANTQPGIKGGANIQAQLAARLKSLKDFALHYRLVTVIAAVAKPAKTPKKPNANTCVLASLPKTVSTLSASDIYALGDSCALNANHVVMGGDMVKLGDGSTQISWVIVDANNQLSRIEQNIGRNTKGKNPSDGVIQLANFIIKSLPPIRPSASAAQPTTAETATTAAAPLGEPVKPVEQPSTPTIAELPALPPPPVFVETPRLILEQPQACLSCQHKAAKRTAILASALAIVAGGATLTVGILQNRTVTGPCSSGGAIWQCNYRYDYTPEIITGGVVAGAGIGTLLWATLSK